MPCCIFTRKQALDALSNEAARQEQEAIPDFIYWFLRDVFYAVDTDGDGYVTANAVRSALPSLSTAARSTPSSSPVAPASSFSSHANGTCDATMRQLSVMAPIVRQPWCSPASFISSLDDAAHNMPRPLDLCEYMQAFWPLVSDKMARLVGDTRSRQSNGSKSGAEHDAAGGSESKSSRPRSPRRRTIFSPSPFRGLSMSPICAAAPRTELQPSSLSASAVSQLLGGGEDVAREQQRLYHETLQQLWPTVTTTVTASPRTHDTRLDDNSSSSNKPGKHASLTATPQPLFPPPQRLFSDEEVEQLQVAFSYLDRNGSGFVSAREVAEALQALLTRAAQCDIDNSCHSGRGIAGVSAADGARSHVTQAAEAMVRLAVSSTTRAAAASRSANEIDSVPVSSLYCNSSPSSSDACCVSWPIFVRSFQCDSGAFPAELVAWCVSCSDAVVRDRGRFSLFPPHQAHRLAFSIQWMSPLECAFVQETLVRYAGQISACVTSAQAETAAVAKESTRSGNNMGRSASKGTAAATAQRKEAAPRGLSQRYTVNVRDATKPGNRRQASTSPVPHAGRSNKGDGITQWCNRLRSSISSSSPSSLNHADGKSAATHAAVLPLALLETSLRNDLRDGLFAGVFDFSMTAGTAAEAILWSHVQAVCELARRFALITASPSSSSLSAQTADHSPLHRAHQRSQAAALLHDAPATLVDVVKLADLIATDPRFLGLGVLVPLSTRLEAVEEAARRVPRRCLEQVVQAVSDHLCCATTPATTAEQSSADARRVASLLRLRRRLIALSPALARLVTGATRYVSGALVLHDCLAVLSARVLSVPPPLRQQRLSSVHSASNEEPKGHVARGAGRKATLPSTEVCAALLANARIVKASRGWLRYSCRRLWARERRDIVAALRENRKARLFETAREMFAARTKPAPQAQQPCLCDNYALLLFHVCASCWTCRVDAIVAAHVALTLLASVDVASEATMTEEALWWSEVERNIGAWVDLQWTGQDADAEERVADAWAMAAICSVAAELGPAACRSVSVSLCGLRSESDKFSRRVIVNEAALTDALTRVVEAESVWAPLVATLPTARDACTRLVSTVVGSCPSRGDGAPTDATLLLQRWLEMCPLPLPVKYLSLCCPIEEVESVYYTLKRLAASEASRRRRSASPQGRAASVQRADVAHTAEGNDYGNGAGCGGEASAAAASPAGSSPSIVTTGITPVCFAELLGNSAVLSVLYAVCPPRAVGVWSGSLCFLEAVLRPVLLSATGVRVSLRKLADGEAAGAEESTRINCGSAVKAQEPLQVTDASAAAGTSSAFAVRAATQDLLVAMAVPSVVQHAVAQLFHLTDADGAGVVTEDQLRSYRPHVPAVARYGWHRFITMLCDTSAASLPLSVSGGFAAGVLRSHCWRRGGSGGGAMDEGETASSVATQRTDDAATVTYTCGGLLARVAELRACVQAQLLEESHALENEREKKEAIPSVKLGLAGATARNATSVVALPAGDGNSGGACSGLDGVARSTAAPTAASAQWWATYLDIFCLSFSTLPL